MICFLPNNFVHCNSIRGICTVNKALTNGTVIGFNAATIMFSIHVQQNFLPYMTEDSISSPYRCIQKKKKKRKWKKGRRDLYICQLACMNIKCSISLISELDIAGGEVPCCGEPSSQQL